MKKVSNVLFSFTLIAVIVFTASCSKEKDLIMPKQTINQVKSDTATYPAETDVVKHVDCANYAPAIVVGKSRNTDVPLGPNGASIHLDLFETYGVSNGPGFFKICVAIPGRPTLTTNVSTPYSDLVNLVSVPLTFTVPNSTANPTKKFTVTVTGKTGVTGCDATTLFTYSSTVGGTNKGTEKTGITTGTRSTTAVAEVVIQ